MPGVFGRCANPSCKARDDRLLRYLNHTVCSYGPCQAYASAQVAARRAEGAQGTTDQQAGSTEQCYVIERVLGVRDCDSHEMSLVSRRAEALQGDDEVVAYQVRGQFGVSHTDAIRAGYDTRWVLLAHLIDTVEYDKLDEALSQYERNVHGRPTF